MATAYNPFNKKVTAIDQPAFTAAAITPDDSNDLTIACRALYVGSQGDVTVIMAGDKTNTPVTFAAMIGFNPIMVKRVMASATDADNIVALY